MTAVTLPAVPSPGSPVVPPLLTPGDRVAVVSPSWAGPGVYPAVHERGLAVLRDTLGLVPVEYPTTRAVGASPAARARDLTAAFADPGIRAVLSTIGGDDQIEVLAHLDPAVLTADPKPFVGYSDNTNLLNWLWFHGVAGYHGGSVMAHLGRAGGPHPVAVASLRHALLDGGDADIVPLAGYAEHGPDWGDPAAAAVAWDTPEPGWEWLRADRAVTGPTWGGNLEIWHWTLAADRYVHHSAHAYAGVVLLVETSEEMPAAAEVFRMLRNAGERGVLADCAAVLVAKAQAQEVGAPRSAAQRAAYRDAQRDAVVTALDRYAPDAVVVLGVDIGHTDPQYVLPYGGRVSVDGPARRIVAHYGPG